MTEELKLLREALRRVKHEAASLADAQVIALEALTQRPAAQTEREADGLPLIVAGAIFDFAGFMTTRAEVIEVGSTAEAGPVADLVKEWAELRGLDLADAAVLSWQLHITRASLPAPQQATPEPVQLDVVRQAIEERDAMESRYHELAKSMTYKGNSVAWWHSKATAYRNAIDEVWSALKAAGIYADGAKTCADGVRELAATPEPVGERWVVVRETSLDVGDGSDVRTGGRPELGYALISDAATFGSEDEAVAAIKSASLPVGWVVLPLSRLLPDLMDTRPAPGVLDVEDLRDRLVAISAAVADCDDRAAQSMLGEILRLLAAQAKGGDHG